MINVSVSDVRFSPAAEVEVATGLLGWVSFELDYVRLDGVAVRRTRDGRLALSYPRRRQHRFVRPLNEETRRAIEAAVFAALGLEPAS